MATVIDISKQTLERQRTREEARKLAVLQAKKPKKLGKKQ